MADLYVPLAGGIDRRSPSDSGDISDVVWRENFLSRDDKNTRIAGTTRFSTKLTGTPTWVERYYSDELGIEQPKTFAYTQDGKLWYIDSATGVINELRTDLNTNAYPRSWSFKEANLVKMFMVDGENLWMHNGNNSNVWDKVKLEDTEGNPVGCIDVIEHRDRLVVLTKNSVHISVNLFPENFTDATDAIEIIVGSGKGDNLALGKIEDTLFIFNTEGIFRLAGDTISAVAETFEVDLVEEKSIISTRSASKVERSILFLGEDREIWAFNGIDAQLLSYREKISDFIDPQRINLDKAVSHYDPYTKYYMLSVVAPGDTTNSIEFFYDTLSKRIDVVRGRNVASYLTTDTTKEEHFTQLGRSDDYFIMWADRERNFDGKPIVTKLRTRDITPKKGRNIRFSAFYPEIEPTGKRKLFFRYLLDGRLQNIATGGVDDCVLNGVFNNWTGAVPDNWNYPAVGTVISQNTHDRYTGLYSCNVSGALYQEYDSTNLTGRNVTLTVYMKSNFSDAWVGIATDTPASSLIKRTYHTGGGEWERLEVNIQLPASCDEGFQIRIQSSSGNIIIDGVVCKIEDIEVANWKQDLYGEVDTVGLIRLTNQAQAIDRIRPKINWSRGQSIAFEIYDATDNMECVFKGIGIDFINKGKKKGKKIGK